MRARTIAVSSLLAAGVLTLALQANAQVVIKQPNAHPDYRVELEPHLHMAPWHWGYHGRYYRYRNTAFGYPEFGGGFYAAIKIADPAFIPSLNNTVGILFGIDFTNCRFCNRDDFRVYTPVALQWNFWITRKWSVFADMGFMLFTDGFYRHVYPDWFLELGARYHFTDVVALTMKIGYPFFPQVGVSFFL